GNPSPPPCTPSRTFLGHTSPARSFPPEDATMNTMRFEVEILRADGAVLQDVVRERVYGGVRVVAEWPGDLATPEIRVGVEVSGDVDRRDAPAYVELFFHDVFLL